MSSRIEKLTAIAEAKKIDCFLLTSAASVKYLSGYFFNFETGPSPFQLLPAALVIYPGKRSTLLIADNETPPSSSEDDGTVIEPCSSYGFKEELTFTRDFLTRLQLATGQPGLLRIGIEAAALPLIIAELLQKHHPGLQWVDISGDLALLRAVKDADEIAAIRQAARLCDAGQAAVLQYARPGMTELELFSLVRRDLETVAGTRVPLMADLVSGPRTAGGGGSPDNRIIKKGDLVLCDLTACLQGYWGDSCNTVAIGHPGDEQKEMFGLVKEALSIGLQAIRPGVRAAEIDRLMRGHIGDFPHHGGHGVGLQYHEEPRIVPYNQQELVPGMVIALEPAIYRADSGLRLEHLALVTGDGYELLTQFQHQLECPF